MCRREECLPGVVVALSRDFFALLATPCTLSNGLLSWSASCSITKYYQSLFPFSTEYEVTYRYHGI